MDQNYWTSVALRPTQMQRDQLVPLSLAGPTNNGWKNNYQVPAAPSYWPYQMGARPPVRSRYDAVTSPTNLYMPVQTPTLPPPGAWNFVPPGTSSLSDDIYSNAGAMLGHFMANVLSIDSLDTVTSSLRAIVGANEGAATDAYHHITEGSDKAVPTNAEKEHQNLQISKMNKRVAKRMQPPLQCILQTDPDLGRKDNEEAGAKRSAKRKRRMEGEDTRVSKIHKRNLRLKLRFTLLNGAPGRLDILGQADMMTEERPTKTVTFCFEANMKSAAMLSDDFEINPGGYSTALKSLKASETSPLDDDGDSDADADDDQQPFLLEILDTLLEQQRLQQMLSREQSITSDMQEYMVHRMKLLNKMQNNQPIQEQSEQQIIRQYPQYGYRPEMYPHNRPIGMEVHENYSYPHLPRPPAIPADVPKIFQEANVNKHQGAYASVDVYPEDNNQPVDLTACTRQIQQRPSRRLRVSSSKPGQKLELIANKLLQLGQLDTEK